MWVTQFNKHLYFSWQEFFDEILRCCVGIDDFACQNRDFVILVWILVLGEIYLFGALLSVSKNYIYRVLLC